MASSDTPISTTASATADILRLSWPTLLGLLAVIGFNLLETLLVKELPGNALASFSLTFPVVGALVQLASGLSVGASALLSQAWGRQLVSQQEPGHTVEAVGSVKGIVLNGLRLATVVALGLLLLGYLIGPALFTTLGASPELLGDVIPFWQIWLPGSACFFVLIVSSSMLRASGDTLTPGIIMVGSAVLNLLLDGLLCFGLFGWVDYHWFAGGHGLVGIAWAFTITRALGVTVSLCQLSQRLKSAKQPAKTMSKELSSNWLRCIVAMVALSIPAVVSGQLLPLTQGVVTRWMSQFGPDTLALYGLLNRWEGLALVGFLAMSSSMVPLIGQAVGSKNPERLKSIILSISRLSLFLGLGLTGLIWIGLTWVHQQGGLLHLPMWVNHYIHWVPFSYGPLGLSLACISGLYAMGKSQQGLLLNSLRFLVIFLPLLMVARVTFGLDALLVASVAANGLIGCLAVCWMQGAFKRLERQWSTPA